MEFVANDDRAKLKAFVRDAASDESQRRERYELALYASKVFSTVGERLHVFGHIIGSDRKDGKSPFGHGSDEAVGVSLLLRMAAQLVSASADLLVQGRPYAGAALLRQIVEIEYLSWAFETRDRDAERWLRSDKNERDTFFRPAKLRKAAQGRFRSQDYGYHCELGGHPVPGGTLLLNNDDSTPQLLLSDLVGHAGRIWDHFLRYAEKYEIYVPIFREEADGMAQRFQTWKSVDRLCNLPPPP